MSAESYKEQIIGNEKKLLEAVKSRDLGQLELLLHDDLMFNAPDGKVYDKASELDAYSSNNMSVDSAEPGEYLVRLSGDTAAVSVVVDLRGEYFSQRIEGKFRYLRIWKLSGSNWKIMAASCIPVEE